MLLPFFKRRQKLISEEFLRNHIGKLVDVIMINGYTFTLMLVAWDENFLLLRDHNGKERLVAIYNISTIKEPGDK